jgi:hypothetical protein
MADSANHEHLSTDDAHHLRQYLVRAAKAYLCVSGWVGIFALLLMHGPPAVSVSPGVDGVVAVIFGVMLSAGIATVLTIVLAVGVLAGSDWIRSGREQDEPDATDGMEDETHV